MAASASSKQVVYAALVGNLLVAVTKALAAAWTLQLAPDQVLAALSLEFANDLRAPDIEDRVIEIERRVRAAHPEVVTLFVKPQTDGTFREAVRRRFGTGTLD